MAVRAHLVPPLAAVLPRGAEAAWRLVEEVPAVTVFATSRTTETAIVDMADVGRVVRKSWKWPRRRDRLKGALRTTWATPSPAQREFEALDRLHDLRGGPFAPTPLGYLDRREGGVLRACRLVLAEIQGAVDLARWLAASVPGRRRTELLGRLAERVREMHDAGLVDFEMHPRNVLVAPRTDDVLKVDCAKQRQRSRPASRGDRARDLAALDVGLVRLVSPPERVAFFAAYGADRALRKAVDEERSRIDARESTRLPR